MHVCAPHVSRMQAGAHTLTRSVTRLLTHSLTESRTPGLHGVCLFVVSLFCTEPIQRLVKMQEGTFGE